MSYIHAWAPHLWRSHSNGLSDKEIVLSPIRILTGSNYWTVLYWARDILVQDRLIPYIIHIETFCHKKLKNYICGTIFIQSHSPKSWNWLVADWYQKFLASDPLKEIGRTTIMSNMVRVQVYRVNCPIIRLYSMARQRCKKLHHGNKVCLQLYRYDGWHSFNNIVHPYGEILHVSIFNASIGYWESDILIKRDQNNEQRLL